MTIKEARELNDLISADNWIEAGNNVMDLMGNKPTVTTKAQALAICRGLFQHLLSEGLYLEAATLQWGPVLFNAEPECVQRVFNAVATSALLLIPGASSMGKSYSVGAWMALDYLKDPRYTSIKLAAVSEKHLRENLFPHVAKLIRGLAIPPATKFDFKEADMWIGIKDAGMEFGISGIAFKQSQETSGQFKGYKSLPVKRPIGSKLPPHSRLRVLADECVRGDQRVSMADGSLITICELVRNRVKGHVLSLNPATGIIEPREITGWREVPRRGRRFVSVNGAVVTYDHRILTKERGFVIADEAILSRMTCLKIDHENLFTFGQVKQGAAFTGDRGPNGRCVNYAASLKGKLQNQIHAWCGPAGLLEMEEGSDGKLHNFPNQGSSIDGVRGDDLQLHNNQPSNFHGNLPQDLHQRSEALSPRNGQDDRHDGACCLVHGRRQFIARPVPEGTTRETIDIRMASGGCSCGCGVSYGTWIPVEAKQEQGKADHSNECGCIASLCGLSQSIYPPLPELQDFGRLATPKASRDANAKWPDDNSMQDMRVPISQAKEGTHLLTKMQNGPSKATEVGMDHEEEDVVFCIDVDGTHNFFVEGVCVHNCQNIPGGPFQDFNSLTASLSSTEKVKIVCAFNPENTTCKAVQLAEPDHGWIIEDLDSLYDYESKAGWRVCRLDAAKSENVMARKVVYDGLQTYDGFLKYLKGGGDNSPAYLCFGRGFPPVSGSVNTIIPPSWPNQVRGEVTFIENPSVLASIDLAFMGNDTAQMVVARWGRASGWRDFKGQHTTFADRLNVSKSKPRHVLQIDQLLPLAKHDDTVKMSEEIIGRCKMMKIKPEWVVIDKTGIGLGVYSHLRKVWGDVNGVSWNEGATEGKILSEDTEGADAQCEGVMSEMWWTFRRWMDPHTGAIFINPIIPTSPINHQLTSRRYRTGKRGIKVEPKDEYKARNANASPDEADAFVMLPHLVRMKGGVLPGLVEERTPDPVIEERTQGVQLHPISRYATVEVDDSISGDAETGDLE